MRQAHNQKRPRGGRSSGKRQVPLRAQNFDSNGPDCRVRGNAYQVYEKYTAMGRDAQASGDRVLAENLFQHAEHYYRLINAYEAEAAEQQRRQQANRGEGEGGDDSAAGGEGGDPQGQGGQQPSSGGRRGRGRWRNQQDRNAGGDNSQPATDPADQEQPEVQSA